MRCREDSVTLFTFFSLFTLIPYFFSFPFFSAQRRVDFVGANCVRPPAIICPPVFWGFGAILGLFWPTRCAPTGFGVIWAHAMRPYGFWGYLGPRDAPLRVLGLFGRTRRQKPPHQVNLDAFREKIFSVQGILTIEKGTHNQIAGFFLWAWWRSL